LSAVLCVQLIFQGFAPFFQRPDLSRPSDQVDGIKLLGDVALLRHPFIVLAVALNYFGQVTHPAGRYDGNGLGLTGDRAALASERDPRFPFDGLQQGIEELVCARIVELRGDGPVDRDIVIPGIP
jgi:hypothetical protein